MRTSTLIRWGLSCGGLGREGDAGAHREGRVIEGSEDILVLPQTAQQPVGTSTGDDRLTGRERLGMARELLDAEHICPQRRLVRVRARACQAGHPFVKAQWQWLHVLGEITIQRLL